MITKETIEKNRWYCTIGEGTGRRSFVIGVINDVSETVTSSVVRYFTRNRIYRPFRNFPIGGSPIDRQRCKLRL